MKRCAKKEQIVYCNLTYCTLSNINKLHLMQTANANNKLMSESEITPVVVIFFHSVSVMYLPVENFLHCHYLQMIKKIFHHNELLICFLLNQVIRFKILLLNKGKIKLCQQLFLFCLLILKYSYSSCKVVSKGSRRIPLGLVKADIKRTVQILLNPLQIAR